MRKWVFIAAGVLSVLLAALASVPWFLNTPAFEAYVSQTATHALGRPVKFESLSIAAFPLPTVKLRGLEVADDPAFGSGPFLTVGEGRLGIRFKPLRGSGATFPDQHRRWPCSVQEGRREERRAASGEDQPDREPDGAGRRAPAP